MSVRYFGNNFYAVPEDAFEFNSSWAPIKMTDVKNKLGTIVAGVDVASGRKVRGLVVQSVW